MMFDGKSRVEENFQLGISPDFEDVSLKSVGESALVSKVRIDPRV